MDSNSDQFLIESVQQDACSQADDSTRIGNGRGFLYTEKPLKLFACLFYGLLPFNMLRHHSKRNHMYISILLTFFQWFSISMYIYCIRTYWTTGNGPRIPTETMVVMVALNSSTAVSFTLTVLYFYSNGNKFTMKTKGRRKFSIIPKVHFWTQNEESDSVRLSAADWLLVNALFVIGIIAVAGVFIGAFAFNSFLDFLGIHKFTEKISGAPLALYLCAVSTVYWGFCATVCTCCMFHAVARNIISHVDCAEELIVNPNISRTDFFNIHETLLQNTETMIHSLKYWFAFHNIFFIFLILATVFEWINAIKRSERKHVADYRIWFAQLAGSSLISYKFAFPFISASRVTARYNRFYYNIARLSKLSDLPDLLVLREHSGFKLFGFRITTSVALLAMLSSFVGALKFIADFNSN